MTARITLPDLSEVLLAREYAYDILRRFFIEEPSQEYLKCFIQQKMYAQFPFKEDSKGISEGISDLVSYFEKFNPVDNKDDLESLNWDFTRMLIGPFELPAPPWESVYVRKDGLLFQESTLRVRKAYRRFGLTASELDVEADDHIGLELDFMYHLNNMCLHIAEHNRKNALKEMKELLLEQQRFLDEHILTFASDFTDNVIENADTQFYAGLAKILKHFLKMDSEVLKELLIIDIIH